MTEHRTFTGSCHCGGVRYEVQSDLSSVVSCNCSICSRLGYVLTFVPAGQFKLLAGEGLLSDYQFNRNIIHHVFCKTCGIHAFARGSDREGNPMCAINVRCLEGVELDTLTPHKVDGRSS